MQLSAPTYEGRIPIDSYGNGGFRVEGDFRPGSLLILPTKAHAWTVQDISEVTASDFDVIINARPMPEILIVGTGEEMKPLPRQVREGLESHGIGIELMTTPSAARSYNVLLTDDRPIAAVLIAV
jgi:uncharacterized protein